MPHPVSLCRQQIRRIQPRLPVVVLTMHGEEQCARRAFTARATDYLTRESQRKELIRAIHKLMERGRYVSPALAERLVVDISNGGDASPHQSLSGSEFEVLLLIGFGRTVGDITSLLLLSDKTISTYQSRVSGKMDLGNSAEIARDEVENHVAEQALRSATTSKPLQPCQSARDKTFITLLIPKSREHPSCFWL
jgi:two-component system invasion response regulator UvrY